MAEDNDSERTEAASPQRIEKAREEGQVARSHELTTFAMLMAGACGLWLLGADLFRQLGAMLQQGLILDVTAASDATQMMSRMHDLALMALLAMAPLLAMLLVVAFAAPVENAVVGDTLMIIVNATGPNKIVSVVAEVGPTRKTVNLAYKAVGALMASFLWVGTLDVTDIHAGPCQILVIATDTFGSHGVGTRQFQRDTRNGKGGSSQQPPGK